MRILSFLLLNLAMGASGFMQAAHASDASTAYIVTYVETASASAGKAAGLLRQFGNASRKESGNLRFEVLQRIGQSDHFVILEAWKDKDAAAAHGAAERTKKFRDSLQALLRGPYDERPHTALSVGDVKAAPAGEAKKAAVYVVTHVDIVPKEKETGVAAVKQLAEDGRKQKGSVRFEALTQNSRTNHMTVVEIWTDRKAFAAHGATPHMKQFRGKLLPMSGSLYDERLYKAVN